MSEWFPLLCWTQSVSSSGYAIMDGQLQIKDEVDVFEEDKAPLQGIHTSMDPEIRQVYEKMKGFLPIPLATWSSRASLRCRNECSW